MSSACGICIVSALLGAIVPPTNENAAGGRAAYSLSNGLRVRLIPDSKAKDVILLLGVRGGFFAEPAGQPHLAHVAEHVVTFGVPGDSDEAKAVAGWFAAGRANAETLAHFMYFDLRVPSEQLHQAIRVQATRLARPEITDVALRREVPRALAELDHLERSALGGTGKFAFSAFVQAALHGQERIRLREATHKLTIDDIRRFWARTGRTDQAILSIVGAFDPDFARHEIAATFGAIPAPGAALENAPLRPHGGSATWDVATRHVVIAWEVPPPSDPDHAALSVTSLLLAQRLQLDAGLGSLARMPIVTNEVERLFIVNVQANANADLSALENRLLDQVERLGRRDGIGALEVGRSRTWLLSSLRPGSLESVTLPPGVTRIVARANIELQVMMRELAWDDAPAYARRVEAVNVDGLRDAARRHLARNRAVVVRVAPRQEVRRRLEPRLGGKPN
jgi:predicted Zn-dependent peptidase